MAYSGNNFDIKTKIYEVLKIEPEKRMIAREIAKAIEEIYPEDCEKKRKKSRVDFSDYSFQDQLVAEIGSTRQSLLKKFPTLKTIETRPRQFYFSNITDENEVEQTMVTERGSSKKFSEHDLYPLLGHYLHKELNTYSMRIDERRSKNMRGSGGNKWLYPDIIGMKDLTQSWDRIAVEAAKASAVERASLLSFEVKLKINRSNIRESFFQTASNSSWANYSYLVASEISEDAMSELRLLSGAHGIGYISLNTQEPTDSQILIPPRERGLVDWNLLNRLATENSDAKKYVKFIRDFYLTGETALTHWDLSKDL